MKPAMPAPIIHAVFPPPPRYSQLHHQPPKPMILPTHDGAGLYVSAQQQLNQDQAESTWAEIKARFLDLRAARAAGDVGRARTAALQLRAASDVYVKLCNKLS